MNIIQTIILGAVEGITEFLPISSTGHLVLASQILGIADSNFQKTFEITIQLGAIVAVVVLYFKRLISDFATWKKVLTAFVPTAIVGFLFYKIIKNVLLSSDMIVVWALFLGGIALIAFELWVKAKHQVTVSESSQITYKKSFFIGVAQSVAAIPGVSRSAATIVGGMAQGISREAIVEFSFLLAVPTMAAATGYDLIKSASAFSFNQFELLTLGFVVSFAVAMASIVWLLRYVKKHTFIAFGVYRIIIAMLFYFFVIMR